jgi:hypothetical protein
MESLRSLKNKMRDVISAPSDLSPIVQFLLLSFESFYVNTYIAMRCLYMMGNLYMTGGFSYEKCKEIVSDEVKNYQEHSPLVSNIGVYLCSLFCFKLLFTIVSSLLFLIIFDVLLYGLLWSIFFGIKEKYIFGHAKKKKDE